MLDLKKGTSGFDTLSVLQTHKTDFSKKYIIKRILKNLVTDEVFKFAAR